jgi:hypothetical protein
MNTTIADSQELTLSQDEALCHLFFHCCLEDEKFSGAEMDDLSAKLVVLGLNKRVNVKEELIRYRSYKTSITDERKYLHQLFQRINPVNELALYSYCVELCVDDPLLDAREEALLDKIREELGIDIATAVIINKLVAQQRVATTQQLF